MLAKEACGGPALLALKQRHKLKADIATLLGGARAKNGPENNLLRAGLSPLAVEYLQLALTAIVMCWFRRHIDLGGQVLQRSLARVAISSGPYGDLMEDRARRVDCCC